MSGERRLIWAEVHGHEIELLLADGNYKYVGLQEGEELAPAEPGELLDLYADLMLERIKLIRLKSELAEIRAEIRDLRNQMSVI